MATMEAPDYACQRGWRDARDIIEAALEQGWRWRRAGQHLRLIPPNGGVPVGVSSTPSDTQYLRQIVRLMRRSGFIWPWPPEGGNKKQLKAQRNQEKAMITQAEPVAEVWRTLDTMSKFEISNGGRLRNRDTGKLIEAAPNGIVALTDDKGRRREKSVRGLVRAHFGHSPIRNVIPQQAAVAHRSREALQMVQEPDNQEESMTATLEADVSTNGHAEHWEPVLIEGVIEGYEVNEKADILAPKNAKFHQRSRLTPTHRNGRMWVNLRVVSPSGVGKYRQYPLDEIALEAFKARPGRHWMPEHIDGDETNCVVENLRWSEGSQIPEQAAEPTPPAVVADEVAEPQQPDPEPEPDPYPHQDYVDRVVAEAPPLTDEQRDRIGTLLHGSQPVDVPVINRATGELVEDEVPEDTTVVTETEPVEEPKPKRKTVGRAKKGKKPAAAAATGPRTIQRTRSYRLGTLSITVDAEGNADLSKAKKLSPSETADMAALLADVAESNKFFGIS